ncbi:MAG: GNAT family N-acetyltransferase [Clostridia bacterium]|nr:GNAT family N-acetyltransferase [Clostridia bacterium]
MEIRETAIPELPACVSLIRESFGTVAAQFGFTPENAPRFTAFAMTEERLRRDLAGGHPMFAALENGQIVGFVSLTPEAGGSCEVSHLAVLPAYRHRGIGHALLDRAEEEARARGCVRMTLSLVDENRRLRTWYESFGYVHTHAVKFDFFPFTCGYMEKPLP